MPMTNEGTGFQATDTSASAAVAMDRNGRGRDLRGLVYQTLLGSIAPMSTDMICEKTGEAYASLQPRLSELQAQGKIIDSGQRGTTRFGRSCILWRPVVAPAKAAT